MPSTKRTEIVVRRRPRNNLKEKLGVEIFLFSFFLFLFLFLVVHLTKCVDPGIPKNGFRVGEDFNNGASVEYFCNPGFRVTAGNRLRRCQKNAKWTGSPPTCEGM